jgi:hypothetical protein
MRYLLLIVGFVLMAANQANCQELEAEATNSKQVAQEADKPRKIEEAIKSLGIRILSGRSPRSDGYFALFEKVEAGWRLIEVSAIRPKVVDFSKQEVLFVSKDLSVIQPDFRTFKYDPQKDDFLCWTGALRTRKENATTDYNPCESSLTTTSNFHAGAQVLFTVVTLGIYSATGTSSRTVVVDKEKVLTLLEQTAALDRVREKKTADENVRFVAAYRNAFNVARTAAQYDAFIRKYSGNDPEDLVPKSVTRRDELMVKENDERLRREAAEKMERQRREEEEKAIAKAEEERQRFEEKQRQLTLARVETFRRSIKIETETNCGPILEIKGKLVKIYAPVANYGNEHWIRREQIFPSGFQCNFFNGNYEPPLL